MKKIDKNSVDYMLTPAFKFRRRIRIFLMDYFPATYAFFVGDKTFYTYGHWLKIVRRKFRWVKICHFVFFPFLLIGKMFEFLWGLWLLIFHYLLFILKWTFWAIPSYAFFYYTVCRPFITKILGMDLTGSALGDLKLAFENGVLLHMFSDIKVLFIPAIWVMIIVLIFSAALSSGLSKIEPRTTSRDCFVGKHYMGSEDFYFMNYKDKAFFYFDTCFHYSHFREYEKVMKVKISQLEEETKREDKLYEKLGEKRTRR